MSKPLDVTAQWNPSARVRKLVEDRRQRGCLTRLGCLTLFLLPGILPPAAEHPELRLWMLGGFAVLAILMIVAWVRAGRSSRRRTQGPNVEVTSGRPLVLYLRSFDPHALSIPLRELIYQGKLISDFRLLALDHYPTNPGPRKPLLLVCAWLLWIAIMVPVLSVIPRTWFDSVPEWVLKAGAAVFLLASMGMIDRWLRWRAAGRRGLDREQLDGALEQVRRWRSRRFGRRIRIVRPAPELWRTAVLAMAELADTIVVDVSRAGEGLLWELEHLLPAHESKCVLIADERSLDALQDDVALSWRTVAEDVIDQLDGRTILVKRGDGRKALEVFAHELREALWDRVVGSLPAQG